MRGKIKAGNRFSSCDVYGIISLSKKKSETIFIDDSLWHVLDLYKSIEFSDNPLNGYARLRIMPHWNKGAGSVDNAYICFEWMEKLGLSTGGFIYAKFNKKG